MRGLLAVVCLLLFAEVSYADPRSHYLIHCMGCHLMDGSGSPPDVPSFDSVTAELASTEEGRRYLIQVPGASQAPIDDGDLAGVLNYILGTYTPDAQDLDAFTANEVAKHRHEILANPLAERAKLVR